MPPPARRQRLDSETEPSTDSNTLLADISSKLTSIIEELQKINQKLDKKEENDKTTNEEIKDQLVVTTEEIVKRFFVTHTDATQC